MIYEDLKVIEVSLTVVAPWSGQDLFSVWMASLLLPHIQKSPSVGRRAQRLE
jgi:hypothetical protein